MCEIKTVSVSVALLVAAKFCIYTVHTVEKEGQQSKNNFENHSENEYKGYCLSGYCYHLLVEDILGCYCS